MPYKSLADSSGSKTVEVLSEEELDKRFPNRPRNEKPTFPFSKLTIDLYKKLQDNKKKPAGRVGLRGHRQVRPHEARRSIIDNFIADWRANVGNDIFPAFRLIMCDRDRDRGVYQLKESKIGKLLVKVMKIAKNSEDAQALVNWKQPGTSAKSAGDFALRCHEIISRRPLRIDPGEMTIEEVNSLLDALTIDTSEPNQVRILTKFYQKMSPDELMWIVRIILKQMKVGATEKTFFDAWHPDGADLFNMSSSLRRVCWELWDPDFRMNDESKGVALNDCFQPQLANFQKKSMETVAKAMGGEFWIEEKLDGERIQMHYDNGKFLWYSRKGKDYTDLYGSNFQGGSICQFIDGAFKKGVHSVILDGEMIEWDPVMDCIVAFGTLKTAALDINKNSKSSTIKRPLFRVFDIVYLNGVSLLGYTLEERRKALDQVVAPINRRIEILPQTPATTAKEVETMLRQVVAASAEGLVIKNPRSAYKLGDRNDDWIKVKPEYMTEFGESLDCLIIGGYWGSGRRGNMLSSYLCGLRVDGDFKEPGDGPHKFWSFFKVGGGFTANTYELIKYKTDGKWLAWSEQKEERDRCIKLGGGGREFERPDVWIHPTKSIVVEAKAASVGASNQFALGLTLRFPRFRVLREDRDWQSALSVVDFMRVKEEAYNQQEEKKMEVEQRRGGSKRAKRGYRVAGADEEAKFLPIPEEESKLFEDKAFFVMTDSTSTKKSKVEIEAAIKACGGRIYQNPTAVRDIILVGDRNNVKVAGITKQGNVNIVKSSWIFDTIEQQKLQDADGLSGKYLLPLEPNHLFLATPETADVAAGNVDRLGDSYARDVSSAKEMGTLLENIKEELATTGVDVFRESLGIQADNDELPGWMFSRCVAYIDTQAPSLDLTVAATQVKFAGGKVVDALEEDELITHVIVYKPSDERLKEIRSCISAWAKIPRVVTTDWAEQSVKERTLLDEEKFAPPAIGSGDVANNGEVMELDG